MDLNERVTELARITNASSPIVSVYLNTRWTDEQQRERVRVFLKSEVKKARHSVNGEALDEDLSWIEREGSSLIDQARFPEAHGAVIFACSALALREVFPVRLPIGDAFVVADAPYLVPLAALLEENPSAIVVFVDSGSARLIALGPEGRGEEITLESEVPGHHRRGGWALLAQSRYQRHIQDHRGRHFEAVAEALISLSEGNGMKQIVIAGEPRNVMAFRKHLPRRIAALVIGSISGARYESEGTIVSRAAELLRELEEQAEGEAVDAVLTEAAKSRRAVAGLEETLDAVSRGAIHHLYVLKGLKEAGRVCVECGTLQRGSDEACHLCGKSVEPTELVEAIATRVIASGGRVETIRAHEGLSRVGGVAALLRYPL